MDENIYLELEDLSSEESNLGLNPVKNEDDLDQIYPEANIKVEREQYPIFQLKRKYDKQQIILDPDFQREDVWKRDQKSELIESVLMGIPLPIFYLNESKNGELVVVDGRQRLTTFFSFLDDEFPLNNLRILRNINGLKFSDLDEKLQANLEDFQLITQVIKPPTPDRIKFDIFDRVNRGGTPLNNQEMRNALYQGKATSMLKELSNSNEFKRVTCNSINSTRMKDRYLILRFLAFYLWRKGILVDANGELIEYRNDIDDFLGKTMEFLNHQNNEAINSLKQKFNLSMNNNYTIFGENSFRRVSNGDKKKPINMILFESFSYLFTHFSEQFCLENKDIIKRYSFDLLVRSELNKLLTNDRGRGIVVHEVLNMIDELKERITNDIPT